MRSFGSLHEASILSVLWLSKEIGRYLAAISPPSALVARPAKVSYRPASRPASLSFSELSQIGQMSLRDSLELAGDRRVGILHRRRILLRRYFQDVLALQRVDTGVGHVVHDRTAADRRFVHRRKAAEHLLALLPLNGRQKAVPFQRTGDARHRHARHRQ